MRVNKVIVKHITCTALRTLEWFTAIGDPGIKF